MLCGVRGAVDVPQDQEESIREAVGSLMNALLTANHIAVPDIVSVFFTITPDLTSLNPAQAIREGRDEWRHVPMLCSQEPMIKGSMGRCIRVLVQWHSQNSPHKAQPVYLGQTAALRSDLLT